jgi:hypothetical protein
MACVFCEIAAYAQNVVIGSHSWTLNKPLNVEISKNGKTVYIEIEEDVAIAVKINKLKSFVQTLEQMKEKYIEWMKTAEENDVTDFTKEMDIAFAVDDVVWTSTNSTKVWHAGRPCTLFVTFWVSEILKDVSYSVFVYNTVTASENRYINKHIFWRFYNPEQIDDLLLLLDVEKMRLKLEEEKNKENLFN